MNTLLTLAILTAAAPAPIDRDDAETVEVFRCDFEDAADRNFDRWPDLWERRRARGFPTYLRMRIVHREQHDTPARNNIFRIEMNGGAAAVFSPPINVSPQFSYLMNALLRMESLQHDVVYCSVTFFDADNNRLETFYSRRFRAAKDWTGVQIGPLAPQDKRIRNAVIGLHVDPTAKADLTGKVSFDDVRLVRFPRMQLTTRSRHNVYYEDETVEVTCDISGISEPNPLLRFELLDVQGNEVATLAQRLDGQKVDDGKTDGAMKNGYVGRMVWKPPIDEFGFYRLRVTMKGRSDLQLQRDTSLVVIRRRATNVRGEFGWSLPESAQPLNHTALADLLARVGINWVKLPFREDDTDEQWANKITELIERLSVDQIEAVGVLDAPAKAKHKGTGSDDLVVASMFAQPDVWKPIVDPVMTRLSLKVRWWQLGNDRDVSFVGYPELAKRIDQIKEHLELFGQKVKLGLPWKWLQHSPQMESPPWEFLAYTVEPPFTARELETYLVGNPAKSAQTWVTLNPLSHAKYDLPTRVLDLVQRMLATKVKAADAVFLPEPFSPERGVMQPDGTPGELLLPWRTTATLLSGAKYEGSIVLPGGSRNYVFSRGAESVMVIWHDRPTREVVFLGHDARVIDVWGRESKPHQEGHRQVINVDRLPQFVVGVNTAVAKWRMSFQFDRNELASVFGRPQIAAFRLRNPFPQGVSGSMTLHTPEAWEAKRQFPIKLSADRDHRESFPVTLRSLASTGQQQVRMDFDFTADRHYQFSVYRELQVGLGDIVIELDARLNEYGHLVVTQTLINNTQRFVSFDCLLYVSGRRRKRAHVLNVGEGRHVRTYVYANGAELIGTTVRLRAREIGGQRVLNYQARVEQ